MAAVPVDRHGPVRLPHLLGLYGPSVSFSPSPAPPGQPRGGRESPSRRGVRLRRVRLGPGPELVYRRVHRPEGRTPSAGERLSDTWTATTQTAKRIRIPAFSLCVADVSLEPDFGRRIRRIWLAPHSNWRRTCRAGYRRARPPQPQLFLQLLAETGIAGFVCVAVPLASCFTGCVATSEPARCWALGVLASWDCTAGEFPLWHANFLGILPCCSGRRRRLLRPSN